MAERIDHYEMSPYDGSYYQVHFKDTPEDFNDTAIYQGLRDGIISSFSQTAFGVQNEATTSVYRKMSDAEVDATLNDKSKGRFGNSEKYVTESLDKVVNLTNNRLSADKLTPETIIDFEVGKVKHEIIKASVSPEPNSLSVNTNADTLQTESIINQSNNTTEMHSSNPVNVEHKKNIEHFIVNNIQDLMVKSNILSYLSKHKLKMSSVLVTLAVKRRVIVLTVFKDGQKIGKRKVTQLQPTVGSVIGAVLCSWIPGLGTLVAGFIGGLIVGLRGYKTGSILFTYLFPNVTSKIGAPETEYTEYVKRLIYGSPEPDFDITGVYGVPITNVNTVGVFGVPQADFEINIMGAPETL